MRIEPNERGRLHVFAVNQPTEEIARVFQPAETGTDRLQPDPELLSDLTGADGLDPKGAELIPLRDLTGLGLSGYLNEGLDVPTDEIEPQKRRLDALDGYALILSSPAFRGAAFALGETASLTHIASFTQPGTDWTATEPLVSEAAKPHTAPTAPRAARNRAQRTGGIIVAAFLLVIGFVIWILVA